MEAIMHRETAAVVSGTKVSFKRCNLRNYLAQVFLFLIPGLIIMAAMPASGDEIGRAALSATDCPAGGLANGTCYEATISDCPGGQFIASIKVNEPTGEASEKGTVFFTTGGGGNTYYDELAFGSDPRCPGSDCGLMIVEKVNTAGFRTVQTNFSDPDNPDSEPVGWLTGPATDGPRALACRYATLVNAVWTQLLQRDTQHPVCATGNSGGGSAITYAITQYGMGNRSGPGPTFTMVEPTSGPPMGRIDHGCMGSAAPEPVVTCPPQTSISESYGIQLAKEFIDPAYPKDYCTTDIESEGRDAYPLFHHDSVLSDDFPAPNYQTVVKAVFGNQDLTQAVPLGLEWYNAITSAKTQACIAGATHLLPGDFDAAVVIVSDLTSLCRASRTPPKGPSRGSPSF
jgi:hypothetical protein